MGAHPNGAGGQRSLREPISRPASLPGTFDAAILNQSIEDAQRF